MQSKMLKLLLSLAIALTQAACIPSQDYLECNLSNGDKFILINKYTYVGLGRYLDEVTEIISHGHAGNRMDEYGFDAYYKPKNGKLFPDYFDSPVSFDPYMIESAFRRKEVCEQFNLVESFYGSPRSLNVRKSNQLERIFFPPNDDFPASDNFHSELTYEEQVKLSGQEFQAYQIVEREKKQLLWDKVVNKIKQRYAKEYGIENKIGVGYQWFGNVNNTLWREIELDALDGVCDKDPNDSCPIAAVWQANSKDNGQTWSAPIITKDAKLFEIGKSILDQPAVAKPGKWKKGPG